MFKELLHYTKKYWWSLLITVAFSPVAWFVTILYWAVFSLTIDGGDFSVIVSFLLFCFLTALPTLKICRSAAFSLAQKRNKPFENYASIYYLIFVAIIAIIAAPLSYFRVIDFFG